MIIVGTLLLIKFLDDMFSDDTRKYIPQDIKLKLAARDGAKCRKCNATENLHIDHIRPISKFIGAWGESPNNIKNLQLLCARCNHKKYNKEGFY